MLAPISICSLAKAIFCRAARSGSGKEAPEIFCQQQLFWPFAEKALLTDDLVLNSEQKVWLATNQSRVTPRGYLKTIGIHFIPRILLLVKIWTGYVKKGNTHLLHDLMAFRLYYHVVHCLFLSLIRFILSSVRKIVLRFHGVKLCVDRACHVSLTLFSFLFIV